MIKMLIGVVLAVITLVGLTGCSDDAQVAKKNMAKAADNFEISRRVVMYNSITDTVLLEVEGKCTVEPGTLRTSVICKTGPGQYIRNFYGKSDNTVYFVEQMDSVPVNVYHYRRTFKPQTLIPDIDYRGSGSAVLESLTPDNND